MYSRKWLAWSIVGKILKERLREFSHENLLKVASLVSVVIDFDKLLILCHCFVCGRDLTPYRPCRRADGRDKQKTCGESKKFWRSSLSRKKGENLEKREKLWLADFLRKFIKFKIKNQANLHTVAE